MKIGIESIGFANWGGGIDFLRHIMLCLQEVDRSDIRWSVLLSRNDSLFKLNKILTPGKNVIRNLLDGRPVSTKSSVGFEEEYLRLIFADFKSVFEIVTVGSLYSSHLRYARKNNYDLIFPCFYPLSKRYQLPWVGYLYDFQHKYYPNLFSKRELKKRDNAFYRMLNNAKHIIVNAHSVKEDANKFYFGHEAKIHVMPFSPSPRLEWFCENDAAKKYGICRPFFLVCNQFWVHKDHETAFRAFAIFLKSQNKCFELVCTGSVTDSRSIDHLDKLLCLAKYLGVEANIKILGHIPKFDQISLLKQSVCLIQPTLFEGGPGGGSAYDAIALGKRIILSDIPVNKEIEDNELTYFFMASDAHHLASKMYEISILPQDSVDSTVLIKKGIENRKKCGKLLFDVINQAIDC